MNVLPRQARDKHREITQTEMRFLTDATKNDVVATLVDLLEVAEDVWQDASSIERLDTFLAAIDYTNRALGRRNRGIDISRRGSVKTVVTRLSSANEEYGLNHRVFRL